MKEMMIWKVLDAKGEELYDFDIKNLMLDYYSAYEKKHRNEPDYKNKVIENAKKVQEFIEEGEYIKAWLHYKEDPYIEMNTANAFDCDNSNRTCQFTEDLYQILWGWKPTSSRGCFFTRFKEAGTEQCTESWTSYEFGGDTMNSFKTTYNRFENVKNKPEELEKFAWNCGKIGNFVLVPAGFNRYRYSCTLDYWDSSLKLLKGKSESDEWNSNGRKVIWDSQYFNCYINTFFLWDYVQKKEDGEYDILELGTREEDSLMLSNRGVEKFLENVNRAIINRGKFMTSMLKIAKLEKGNIYEMFRENVFESDRTYEGYEDVIQNLLELIEDKIEKNVLKAEELERVKEILIDLEKNWE